MEIKWEKLFLQFHQGKLVKIYGVQKRAEDSTFASLDLSPINSQILMATTDTMVQTVLQKFSTVFHAPSSLPPIVLTLILYHSNPISKLPTFTHIVTLITKKQKLKTKSKNYLPLVLSNQVTTLLSAQCRWSKRKILLGTCVLIIAN